MSWIPFGTVVGVLASARCAALTGDPMPGASQTALAQIKDEKQLAEVLSSITNDPAIPVDDPRQRPLAQALMIEGVKHLQARAYDQALANFLEAYAKFPSPKIRSTSHRRCATWAAHGRGEKPTSVTSPIRRPAPSASPR
jgi:hypothetical protein